MKDYTGTKKHSLTAVRFSHRINCRTYWVFSCDCGKEKAIRVSHVFHGTTRTCGCIRKLGNKIDGALRRHPLIETWKGMKKRCFNKSDPNFKHYGGRGIIVCTKWVNSFADFINDIGPKPSREYTLDRINNNGNYEPGNIRWATFKTQARNRRGNRFIEHEGELKTISEWAEIYNIDRSKLRHRLINRWQFKDAVLNNNNFLTPNFPPTSWPEGVGRSIRPDNPQPS